MYEIQRNTRGSAGRHKKKIAFYKLNSKKIGYGQQVALIRYFLHINIDRKAINRKLTLWERIIGFIIDEPYTMDDFAKYWAEIEYLSACDVIGVSNIPLRFTDGNNS